MKLSLNLIGGLAAMSVAAFLAVGKFTLAISGGSISLLASAADSGFDFITSLVNFLAMREAEKPADSEHRYGHGKMEALAGFLQSLLVFAAAAWIIWNSIRRFLQPEKQIFHLSSVVIMIISLVLTILLVMFQNYIARRTSSLAIRADRMHYVSDIAANAAVLAALALQNHLPWLDPVIGFILALFIFKSGAEIFLQSFHVLSDRDVSDRFREFLLEYIRKNPEIKGYHDLRSRSAGSTTFVEIHVELAAELSLKESHDIADRLQSAFEENFGDVDLILHADPVTTDGRGRNTLLDHEKPKFY